MDMNQKLIQLIQLLIQVLVLMHNNMYKEITLLEFRSKKPGNNLKIQIFYHKRTT